MADNIEETLKERGGQYGDFETQGELAQRLKSLLREHNSGKGWHRLRQDQQEALDMIEHKISRILNGNPNNIDSWADIAGYATLISNRIKKDEEIPF